MTVSQFREQLAAQGGKTVRQRVREHAEQDVVAALSAIRGISRLPAFPVPPYEPPMKIDVPDPVLNQQWRLVLGTCGVTPCKPPTEAIA